MSFDVAAEAYDRFMGRYSRRLSAPMVDLAGLSRGQSALDVGCGTGMLTDELVRRLGAESVCAVDPSIGFVAAAEQRLPGVTAMRATAEELPFDDGRFDATLAQLVVHFMSDPVAGVAEMRRVTRPGGRVVACVWDIEGGGAPMNTFLRTAAELWPEMDVESGRSGAGQGLLPEIFGAAGLTDVTETALTLRVMHPTFEEWWEPYTLGVGPAGDFVASLDDQERERLLARLHEVLPERDIVVTGRAWAAVGRA